MADPGSHAAHDEPLANRLVDDEIGQWLAAAFATALAGRNDLGTEPAERDAINELRNLHLSGWSYALTPRILDALRRAGLLRAESEEAQS